MFLRKVEASEITVLGFAVCTSDVTGQVFWESSAPVCDFFSQPVWITQKKNTVKNE